jgi:hypothetical protein
MNAPVRISPLAQSDAAWKWLNAIPGNSVVEIQSVEGRVRTFHLFDQRSETLPVPASGIVKKAQIEINEDVGFLSLRGRELSFVATNKRLPPHANVTMEPFEPVLTLDQIKHVIDFPNQAP